MAGSIRSEPLLAENFESDIEDELQEGDTENSSVGRSDEEPFIKPDKLIYDKYNIAYLVFYLLGLNTLIPWGFFITADDYWMYKFREIDPNETSRNFCRMDNYGSFGKRSDLQASFTSYISVSSAIPNTLFLIINTFISKTFSLSSRMIVSQCVILFIFIITTTFVKVNTDAWQNVFLIVTLVSVAITNAAAAIFAGSLMGIVGKFPSKYITAMSAGQALGGVFTALTEIFSIWIGVSPVISGLTYFAIGDIVLFISLIAYIMLERQYFFKHHMFIKTNDPDAIVSINSDINFPENSVSYHLIFKRTWCYGISMFIIFFVTLTVYPSLTVLIESQGKGHGYLWNDRYFNITVTYLIFSCGDYIGRVLSGLFMKPKNKPWLVLLLSCLRVLFIPLFIVCNAQPRHNFPVYIHQDEYYILLTVLFALSNGYLCNLAFVLAPTVVRGHEKEIAASMMGAFLGLGLAVGSPISLLLVKIL